MKEIAWLSDSLSVGELKQILFGLNYDATVGNPHPYSIGYGDDCLVIVRAD